MIPFPNKKYSIIYADPPWSYSDSGCSGAAAAQYATMSINELKQLPVNPAGGGGKPNNKEGRVLRPSGFYEVTQ